jgi:hypothetical protein
MKVLKYIVVWLALFSAVVYFLKNVLSILVANFIGLTGAIKLTGLSYRPIRLQRLAGQYDNPMP